MNNSFFKRLKNIFFLNPYIYLLSTSWKYSREKKNRYLYVLIYVFFLITNSLAALYPLLYGWFVDSVQNNLNNVISNVWLYVGGYFCLTLLYWLFHGPGRLIERKLAFNISANFLNSYSDKLVHLPMSWHKNNHSGSLINRLRKSSIGLRSFFENGFLYFQTIIQLVISISAIIYFSTFYGSIGITLAIISIWINFKIDTRYIKTLGEINENEHKLSSTLTDGLGNIMTVIMLRMEQRIKKQISSVIKKMYPSYKKATLIVEIKWFIANVFVAMIYVIIVLGYTYNNYTVGKVFKIGGLVTLLGFVTQFTTSFNSVVSQYTNIIQFYTDVKSIDIIQSEFNKIQVRDKLIKITNNWKSVELKHLNFKYRKNKQENYIETPKCRNLILDNINLKLLRGENVALIGESGAGKSTLLSLMGGVYSPELNAKLIIDDKIDFQWGAISETVTLFPQDPEMFENTILFNLTLGILIDQSKIEKACQIACIDEMLEGMPDGLNSMVNERGGNLSGGQKQRIALARGILASNDSSILLFDEPTSSIDRETELRIYQNILSNFQNKLIISTIHNLGLIELFDRCIKFEDGKIVEIKQF